MSVNGRLFRGERLKFGRCYSFPLEKLEVEAGTEIVVAEDCSWSDSQVAFYFADESLRQLGKGAPFYAHRHSLEEREAVCPANG